MCGDGKTKREVRRRVQAGANARRAVEGVMADNNWVRKITRVKRADRRRIVELREETGVQMSLTERLAGEEQIRVG